MASSGYCCGNGIQHKTQEQRAEATECGYRQPDVAHGYLHSGLETTEALAIRSPNLSTTSDREDSVQQWSAKAPRSRSWFQVQTGVDVPSQYRYTIVDFCGKLVQFGKSCSAGYYAIEVRL